MSVPGGSNSLLLATAAGAGGYEISRSLRFNSADSAYLSRTPASAGNRKTWTWAGWVKRSALTSTQHIFSSYEAGSSAYNYIQWNSADKIRIYGGSAASTNIMDLQTNSVFRDASAWYHLVVAFDTTQSTSTDRVKVYVNGVEQTFSTATYPTQNIDYYINSTFGHRIGDLTGADYLNGYLADVHFIDGQALDPTSFTEVSATTGQLIPKAYTGTFTGNSFWLKFADNSAATATTLGKDSSGLGNNWTPNNLSVTAGAGNDSLVDTPTSYGTDTGAGGEVRGNYCTWNPINETTGTRTLTNGNLDASIANSGGAGGTVSFNSGKWYYEATINSTGAARAWVGWLDQSFPRDRNDWSYGSKSILYASNGAKATDNTSYGATYTTGDVIGCALDLDGGTATFYKNGVSQGTMGSSLGATNWRPLVSTSDTAWSITANFGQRPFAYPAPSGFKALCTTNLPDPVVAKPSEVMDVKLWTGTGSNQTITTSFSPDFVWAKPRSAAASHGLYDTVRGNNLRLSSNQTAAEGTVNLQMGSTGFTVEGSSSYGDSGVTYVGWVWDAGSSTVTNTQGSITSQVRANASAGFSIVTYTGTGANATVGHGLGAAPGWMVIKDRDNARNWSVYHSSNGPTYSMELDGTGGLVGPRTAFWNDTAPTSSVFSLGSDPVGNASGQKYVAYCFAPVAGYSSFGSYTGNGSADGPFVYTGHRPSWIMLKCTGTATSSTSWIIWDSTRNTYNMAETPLRADLSDSEILANDNYDIDILSNGFKIRTTNGGINAAKNYIFASFAESPFQYARAR